jgi:N-glycosylase/DNA lyase
VAGHEKGRKLRNPWRRRQRDRFDLLTTPQAAAHIRSRLVAPAIDELVWAWSACSDLYTRATAPRSLVPTRTQFERELLFCLLGGFGVCFELAVSAAARLTLLEPFSSKWSDSDLIQRLANELSLPQFEPRNAAGVTRRYRFPTRKAHLIVGARRWLIAQGAVSDVLVAVESETERRRLLCQCPGVGNKTASWILRNLGLATRLAILDVHVVRALQAAGRISNARLPRDYEAVEAAFIEWCDELSAPPAAFDLFVWDWQRGLLATPT